MSDEEENQSQYSPYNNPAHNFQSSIITLTDPSNDLYKFELFLRNLRESGDGQLVKIGGDEEWKPLLNDRGINSVMSSVESLVHQTNALSNFNDVDMKYLILGLADTITKDLMLSRLDYQINRKNRDLVLDNSVRFAYGFIKRSINHLRGLSLKSV